MGSALANGIAFNISWLAIVGTGSNLIAPAVVLVHLLCHLSLLGKPREYLVIAAVTVAGALLDQVIFALGILKVEGGTVAPFWLSCLWPVLATTLLHAFSFLQGRWALAAAFGAVGGCGSYLAGTRISVVEFGSDLYSPMIIALLWAVLLPLLLHASHTFINRQENPVEA